jgi:hypothetical protein
LILVPETTIRKVSMSASDFVTLIDGPVVPLAALRLAWSLEDRGLTLRLDKAGGLLVGPGVQLTAEDRALIHAHRDELIALVRYTPPGVH